MKRRVFIDASDVERLVITEVSSEQLLLCWCEVCSPVPSATSTSVQRGAGLRVIGRWEWLDVPVCCTPSPCRSSQVQTSAFTWHL